MSSKAVRDAVGAYIEANWADTVIVGDENEFDEPPANLDPWLTYGFAAGPEDIRSIGAPGNNCTQEIGTVNITVLVASGRSTAEALTHAESVRTMMRGSKPISGLRFTTIDPPETSFPSRVQASSGNWFGYQVSCNYTYNYQA